MLINIIIILFAGALLCAYLLIPVFEKFGRKKGYLTVPNPQKIDSRSMPFFGGLAMFCAFMVVLFAGYFLFNLPVDFSRLAYFFLASLVIVAFGFYDDLREVSPGFKLIGQGIGALILVFTVMRTEIIYLNYPFNIVLSILWFLIMANAFNLLDILDGLAGGISAVNLSAFLLFGFLTRNYFVMLMSAILLGAVVAFLKYNLPPARIFMGDAGSQFLGFFQAAMAISLSFAPSGHEVRLVIPLVILSVPFFDLLFVILMRIVQKKSIFFKSNDHFVYRMLKAGVSKSTVLKTMIILSLLTNVCAFLIMRLGNFPGLGVFFLLIIGIFLFGFKLSKMEMN